MEEVGAGEVGSKVDERLSSDIVASDGSAVAHTLSSFNSHKRS